MSEERKQRYLRGIMNAGNSGRTRSDIVEDYETDVGTTTKKQRKKLSPQNNEADTEKADLAWNRPMTLPRLQKNSGFFGHYDTFQSIFDANGGSAEEEEEEEEGAVDDWASSSHEALSAHEALLF